MTKTPIKTLLLSALVAATAAVSGMVAAQQPPAATRPAATTQPMNPLTYRCVRAKAPLTIDGRASDPAWAAAPWTTDFVDIEGDAKPKPYHRTRAKMLWDDQYLYVYAELEDPHVWGTFTKRNSVIYQDNDFEIFIDPDGDRLRYYEFEINALGTIMELRMPKPYKDGGNYTFVEMEGIKSAVHVNGTVNNPTDTDHGWSVEVAIPHAGLAEFAAGVGTGGAGPKAGDTWRINFSRVHWTHQITDGKYVKIPKKQKAEENWVWSPQGAIDMHKPEKWGRLEFVTGE